MPLLPELIVTPRLRLRVPDEADSAELNAVVSASFAELTRWLPWAQEPQTLAETEDYCRLSREKWLSDECLNLLMVTKSAGAIIGSTGYPRLDWEVPSFEIGYWCSTAEIGRGYVAEAQIFNIALHKLYIRCFVTELIHMPSDILVGYRKLLIRHIHTNHLPVQPDNLA